MSQTQNMIVLNADGNGEGVRNYMERLGNVETHRPAFLHPCNVGLYGTSNSRKTTFLVKLLSDVENHFRIRDGQKFDKILYCYGSVWQEKFDILERKGVVFHKGLPEDIHELFENDGKPAIVVLDDLMAELIESKEMQDLVTKNSHHLNISVFITFQCLFPLGKMSVSIRQQLHVCIFFKILNGDAQLKNRLRAVLADSKGLEDLLSLYKKWTTREGGYMIHDGQPGHDKKTFGSLRTNIFPDESPMLLARIK